MLSQKVIIYFFPTIQIFFALTYFQCFSTKCVSDNNRLNIKHLITFKALGMQW